MSDITKIEQLEALILALRQQRVLLDRDVATLYGVETRDINKAVANNPEKFPAGYLFELTKEEKTELVENFHRFEKLKHATAIQQELNWLPKHVELESMVAHAWQWETTASKRRIAP